MIGLVRVEFVGDRCPVYVPDLLGLDFGSACNVRMQELNDLTKLLVLSVFLCWGGVNLRCFKVGVVYD